MSAFAEYRQAYFRALATASQEVPTLEASLPPHLIARWQRLWKEPVTPLLPRNNYVNRFLIGADPELWFATRENGARAHATQLGLKAGLAFGADNNGRLVELRPAPSRSTLAVLASIAAELRWMSWIKPELADFGWFSGSYNGEDGIGGHVHFGRKREQFLREEAMALDTLTHWLFEAGVFSRQDAITRIQRSDGHGGYGRLSDLRRQAHGYEYRTMPSWLDSPWLAFFVLTLCKLAVYDPSLLPVLGRNVRFNAMPSALLVNLLRFYKHSDDDAALAYTLLLEQGVPHYDRTDFRARWGVFPPARSYKDVKIIPSVIHATPEEITEMHMALRLRRVPEPVTLDPTWSPAFLPDGYLYVPSVVETHHAPGFGELVVGLACHRDTPQPGLAGYTHGSQSVSISNTMVGSLPKNWREEFGKAFPGTSFTSSSDHKQIRFSSGINWLRYRSGLRDWLCTYFPYWRVEDVRENSLAEFLSIHKKASALATTQQKAKAVVAAKLSRRLV